MAAPMLLMIKEFSSLNLRLSLSHYNHCRILYACYAKKVGGVGVGSGAKGGAKLTAAAPVRMRLVPETDPEKLTRFLCGGDISREGGHDPELRPEPEYPDWLWTLRTSRESTPLEELDPNGWAYWKKLHKFNKKEHLAVMRDKYKYHKF